MLKSISHVFLIYLFSLLVACGGIGESPLDSVREDGFQNITPSLLSNKTFYYTYEDNGLTIFEKLTILDTDTLRIDAIIRDSLTGDSGLAGDFSYTLSKGNLIIPLEGNNQTEFKLKEIHDDFWMVKMTSGDIGPLALILYFERPPSYPVDIQ